MADRSRKIAGVPIWVLALGAIGIALGLAFVAMHFAGVAPTGHTM